jgi:hypothetical protein
VTARRFLLPLVCLALLAPTSPPAVATSTSLVQMACSIPHEQLLRIWRGVDPGRSGDIQILPQAPNFVNGGLSHAGPWPYTQDVPMFWYGPGWIRPGTYSRPVTEADVAPTEASLLNFHQFHAPDGTPMTEALLPKSQRSDAGSAPPPLIVTLVWDAGGWDVLNAWKHEWPYLHSLFPKGALYTHATSGSSPSNTPPIHATIGTGAFPSKSGIADDYARIAGGIEKPYELGPGVLMEPTLADLYDRDMGNRPIVGAVATLDAHLGMLGHGSLWGGGDKDIAVTRQLTTGTAGAEGFKWNLSPAMAPYYRFPSYVNSVPGFQSDLQKLDLLDGQDDGKWRNNPIQQMHQGFDTPARTPYQTRIIEQIISREGFGKDSVPDLLYLNYKAIDTIGHLFSLNSLEMKDAVSYQDVALRQLVDFLNRVVGQNRWVMVLTADHGHQYDPAVSGAFLIGIDQLQADIEKRFDTDGDGVPVVQKMRTTQLWVNQAELAQNGSTLDQVAQYISQLTEADTVKPTETIKPGHADDRVFAAAFPTSLMPHLPCLQGASPG